MAGVPPPVRWVLIARDSASPALNKVGAAAKTAGEKTRGR